MGISISGGGGGSGSGGVSSALMAATSPKKVLSATLSTVKNLLLLPLRWFK